MRRHERTLVLSGLRSVAILVQIGMVVGCATFPGGELQDPRPMALEPAGEEPTAYILPTFKTDLGTPVENTQALGVFKNAIEKATTTVGLFSEFTFEAYRAREMDYIVKLEMTNSADIGSAMLAGFITGLTLFVIPSYATDVYSLRAEVLNQNDEQLATYSLDSFVRTWFGIWLLPAAGRSPRKEVPLHLERMVANAYGQFLESGIFGVFRSASAPPSPARDEDPQ
ncbi:MAG: hypothetical protein ACQGVK_25900 [Myxococcota bacterium]